MDAGLVVDFFFCLGIYVLIREFSAKK
jgi:hypothetical protein